MGLVNKNYIVSLLFVATFVSTLAERSILVNPDNATISLGDTVTFSCTVTEHTDGGTTVEWHQKTTGDFKIISSNYGVNQKVDDERYTVASDNVGQEYNLQITNVKASDEGEYKCVISDSDGNIIEGSPIVWLTYKFAPRSIFPECVQPSGELTYQVGEEVKFSCRSEFGVPPVQLIWTSEDGSEVEAQQVTENPYQMAEFSKIITREDNGRSFECNLIHELVTVKKSCVVGKLNVQFPPMNVKITPTVNNTLEIGGTFSVSCGADANPPIDPSNIQWNLPSDIPESKIQLNDQIGLLAITDIEASFSGSVVQCSVENDLGESSASFTLEVVIPPTTTPAKGTTSVTPSTPTQTTPSLSTTAPPKTNTVLSSLKAAISTSTSGSEPLSSTKATTPQPRALPDEKQTTLGPALTLAKILGVERNFLIALMIGVGFIIFCFALLLCLVLGKRRGGKTIVLVDSQENLRKLSLSEASVNGTKILIRTPVMDRRNRTTSENPSDNQSVDSAIQLVSPIYGDQPDYRGQPIHRNKSNLSSGNGYIRVPSTELLIDPQSQVRLERPQYVVYDMVSQNGTPFPLADKSQNIYQYATTGRPQVRKVDTSGFETIPLRSVRQEQDNELYLLRGGEYIPVQCVRDPNFPSGNSQVQILVGGSDNSSEEEVNIQESKSLLDPRHHPA